MELDGRVVVITRGISEIGLALAARCQKEGAIVVLSDTNEKSLLKIADETGEIPIAGDTTQPPDIKSLVDKTRHRFGRIDLFVSNASLDTFGTSFPNGRDCNASCLRCGRRGAPRFCQDRLSADAAADCQLRPHIPGSQQRQLCRADDERRARADGGAVRIRIGLLLSGLLLPRASN